MRIVRALVVIGILTGGTILYEKYNIPAERVEHWIDPSWIDPVPNQVKSEEWLLHELIVYTTPEKAAVMYEQLQGERSMNATEFLDVPPEHLFLNKFDAPNNGVLYVSFVEYQGRMTKAAPKDYKNVFGNLPMIWKGKRLSRPESGGWVRSPRHNNGTSFWSNILGD